jgi:hypothetical protein
VIALLDAVGDDWGTEYTPTGKHVWFRLAGSRGVSGTTAAVPGPRSPPGV